MSLSLTRESIDPIFAPFLDRRGLLVGVSGGPDSLALLMLAAYWAETPDRPPVFAATVDHGLRAESRAEAERVAAWARHYGVPHAILRWEGAKPRTRLQETARDARYALLTAHAAILGADTLLTAHHADDQAETILFRLTRGSGVGGLAGMARETLKGEIFHARPLLDYAKADLIALCETNGQDFIRDPSNLDPRFARTGLRELTAALDAAGLGRDQLLRLGARARRADEALAAMTEAVLRDIDPRRTPHDFSANIARLRAAPFEPILRILRDEIERIAGARLRLDRLETLVARLKDALESGAALRATLCGALVRLDRSGELTIAREIPRQRGRNQTATNTR